MTRNDGFYKVLFAIEIALLPLVIFAYLFMPQWSMGVFIAGILVCKVWREIFKDRYSFSHIVVDAIASSLEFGVLLIFLACNKLFVLPLAIVAAVLVLVFSLIKVAFFNKKMPETIQAVDFCFTIFEGLTLATLVFITKTAQPATIAVWALLLTTAASILYKLYYGFRYEDWFAKIKGVFRKK